MLKALEIFGFKSFADRTRFDFSPGVTGVVGPNGSGKSNVVDAIKWILGDQSPKSLRGKEMTDVIFNGSSSRKPAGLAEATLTFDNRARTLSVDQDEVLIGRRIYRSGEAEYLINRVPARLKDVRDLFLGTGAGTAAYSIIEQGRVDQLLQASNTSRRLVFEEAAGVSRYKAKKVEAQRKLERIAQNLLRLTDIVKEVETQLLTMRSQATKAAKFRELSHELRTLSIGLGADDYRDLSSRLDQIERERTELQQRIAEVSTEAQASESQHRGVEAQLTEIEDRLRAAERREAENREAIAGHEATIHHQLARRQELDAEFIRLEQQQTNLIARSEQVVGELQETDNSLQRFSGAFEERRAALEADTLRLHELATQGLREREALERQREQLLASVRQSSMFDNRAASLESQLEHRQAEQARSERLERLDAERDACRQEVIRCQTELAAGLDQAAVYRERLSELEARRAELIALRTDVQQSLVESREQRSALQARKSVLEDLDRRQEGLGMGVKDILARARAGEAAPWKHVLGHVVELLEVDLENAALLEVALGGRAQLIVLDEMQPLVDFLREGSAVIAGRVGFLSVRTEGNPAAPALWNTLQEQRQLPDLSGRPGVLNRADRLVRSAAGIHRLAEQLLADTWIVNTLDDAVAFATETGGQCRFVTMQGELLESNGILFAGSLRGETALVSRKSELRGIKADVQRLDRQIAGEEDALSRMAHDLAALEQQQQQVRQSLDDFVQSLGHLKSAASSQEMELERLERSRGEARHEATANAAEQQQIQAALEAARGERERFHADLQNLQTDINRLEAELIDCDRERQELQAATAAERTELAKHEERLENLRNARSRLDEERYQRDLHREEAERRFQLISDKRDRIELEIAKTNSILETLTGEKQVLADGAAVLQAERDDCRKARGELAERESGVRRRVRELEERVHSLNIKASEATHQLTHLCDRIRDEFQVEVAEAASEGISARQEYLDARSASADPAAEDGSTAEGQAVEGSAAESGGDSEPAPAATPRPKVATGADPLREELEQKLHRCRRRLKQLGQVNTDSLKELDELEGRYARLSSQLQDLIEARDALEEIIRRINAESRRMFSDTFDTIRKHFQDLFRQLFGGGEGDAVLEDPNDILECGIDIVARPPGKELRSISLLSGGEKTMTAVALLLAVFRSRPSPFCILDEVDAALDEGNVERYLGVLREFQQWTQFIVITHSKRTMSGADVLYGVTMEEAGISKRMSVRFEDIGNDGHFTTPQAAEPGGMAQAA